MICSSCGKENHVGTFCAYCGKKLNNETEAAPACAEEAGRAPVARETPAYPGTRKIELTPDRSKEHPERYRPLPEEQPREAYIAFSAAASMSSRPKVGAVPPAPSAPPAPAPYEHREHRHKHRPPVGEGTVDAGIALKMTVCKACGAKIPSVSRACTVCGTSRREHREVPREHREAPREHREVPRERRETYHEHREPHHERVAAPSVKEAKIEQTLTTRSAEKRAKDQRTLAAIYAVCGLVLAVAIFFAVWALVSRKSDQGENKEDYSHAEREIQRSVGDGGSFTFEIEH